MYSTVSDRTSIVIRVKCIDTVERTGTNVINSGIHIAYTEISVCILLYQTDSLDKPWSCV